MQEGENRRVVKKISSTQIKSQLRKIERDTKKAVSEYNNAVRKYNTAVRELERDVKRTVSDYNFAVRKHNANVRRNRQIIQREFAKLNTSNMRQNGFTITISSMQNSYSGVTARYREGIEVTDDQNYVLDLIEQEHANGLVTANCFINNSIPETDTNDIELGDKLSVVSEDLANRWKGAVFALSPHNPDAARHFCTSARELLTEFIESKAPDKDVFLFNPDANRTDRGNATRKEKIRYMMRKLEMDDTVTDFADDDISNILELFHVLSDATHGSAGRYEYEKLLQVKKRVEQGINFLCALVA